VFACAFVLLLGERERECKKWAHTQRDIGYNLLHSSHRQPGAALNGCRRAAAASCPVLRPPRASCWRFLDFLLRFEVAQFPLYGYASARDFFSHSPELRADALPSGPSFSSQKCASWAAFCAESWPAQKVCSLGKSNRFRVIDFGQIQN